MGYLAIAGTYVIALSLVVGLSPRCWVRDQIIRLSDLPVWLRDRICNDTGSCSIWFDFNAMG
ncbi:MAG: hypothetical protein CM15mP105_0560 [Methanobacteriota archaeon]|nr:MAG: hypothetical protein CM15mP105_0560 [Euryarchaeota archaeon]